MIDISILTIKKAHEDMKSGKYSAVDLAKTYLDEISKKNKELNAYLEVFKDVLQQAEDADKRFKDGTTTLLTGIPFAIKDNILIKGNIASSASKILENYHATYNATIIEKLKKENAVFIGRTNMDEFAMGGSTENSAYGVTKNPFDTSRVAGGSSGGSATAVASNMALVALGSDTGGSIRQPASFCGLIGLKPTYGRVSRYGVMSLVSSFDQIGPFGKTVNDVEIIYNSIKGQDEKDSTTINNSTYEVDTTKDNLVKSKNNKKLVIGIPRVFLKGDGIDKDIMKNFNDAIEKFKNLGYEIKDIILPNIEYSLAVYYIINFAEASSNLSRFDGMRFGFHKEGINGIDDYFETRGAGFGKEVRRRILLGTYVLSSGYYDAYYNRANVLRKVISDDFLKAFQNVDIILTPTTPPPAFKIGEKNSDPVA
ncbi:MAG: Asp-tRNA(Asn)/Glu-tRNA(Gln) amidotransferase subunit GatA, partial [Patescibacteria group bacterium]